MMREQNINRKPKQKPKRNSGAEDFNEMKISLEEFKGKFEQAEEIISEFEDRTM